MPIQPDHLPVLYSLSKDACEGKISIAAAGREINRHAGIPRTSAGNMIHDLKKMLRGVGYQRRLNAVVTEYFLRAIHRDFSGGGLSKALDALWAHIEYVEGHYGTTSRANREIHVRLSELLKSRSSERFPVEMLSKVSPEHIWRAVQGLQDGSLRRHPFGESMDFDLIGDDGHRLPPKAVFGIALGMTLGISVKPKHFYGGEGSPCFRLLREAGYRIIPKDEPTPTDQIEIEEGEWEEGRRFIRSHVMRERAPGLAKAKKEQFRRSHGGVLKCEQCGEVPADRYGTELADSCIEVHHAKTLVSEMGEKHKTRLEDLECLCANCHRLVHRRMRAGVEQ